jgi:hypothetical protein
MRYAKYIREINSKKRKKEQEEQWAAESCRLTLDPIDADPANSPHSPASTLSMSVSPQKPGTKKDPYASTSPVKPIPEKPVPGLVEEKSPPEAAAAEPSVGEASYGEDFEDVVEGGGINGGKEPSVGGGQLKAEESSGDGIYDDDDEDFESYTSKKIEQHAAVNSG